MAVTPPPAIDSDRALCPDNEPPQNSPEPRAGGKGRGHGAKSQEVRERAIVALLSENTIAAAAERCGLNEKTLRVWMAGSLE